MKRYYPSLDNMILAVEHALKGRKRKAAAALDKVLDDPQTERALAALSKDQAKALDKEETQRIQIASFRRRRRGRQLARKHRGVGRGNRWSRFVGEAVVADDDDFEVASIRKARKRLSMRARRNLRSLR